MEIKERDLKLDSASRFPDIDLNFRPRPIHLAIIREARRNDGIYDRRQAVKKIRDGIDQPKLQEQRILWNERNIKTLENAGFLMPHDNGNWRLNPLINELSFERPFSPGKNHLKLLQRNKNGKIIPATLKAEVRAASPKETKRQRDFIDGMIRTLNKNGYLTKEGKGKYSITIKGEELLKQKDEWVPARSKTQESKAVVKMTRFDEKFKEVADEAGKIDLNKLKNHPKGKSLFKRMVVLEKTGLIKDGTLTEAFNAGIDRVLKFTMENKLTIEKLTEEQLQIIKDMRIFLNLTGPQIVNYIYQGSKLGWIDLDFLVKHKILKKDENYDVYVFDSAGIRLSNELFSGDAVRYHTKLHSRPEEVKHDALVYTAYCEWLKELTVKGGTVTALRNDRQLRRDASKEYGHMTGVYPDLRIEYKDSASGQIKIHDVEIDCGYDGKVIKSKLEAFAKAKEARVTWCCNSANQALKVMKIIEKNHTKKIGYQKKIDVFWIDGKGELHKTKK